jgi:hypothetical protein
LNQHFECTIYFLDRLIVNMLDNIKNNHQFPVEEIGLLSLIVSELKDQIPICLQFVRQELLVNAYVWSLPKVTFA